MNDCNKCVWSRRDGGCKLLDCNFIAVDEVVIREERKTGRWLPDNNNYYEERYICSACGKSYKVDTCMGEPLWHFCPSCGADMRKEGEADG